MDKGYLRALWGAYPGLFYDRLHIIVGSVILIAIALLLVALVFGTIFYLIDTVSIPVERKSGVVVSKAVSRIGLGGGTTNYTLGIRCGDEVARVNVTGELFGKIQTGRTLVVDAGRGRVSMGLYIRKIYAL